MFAIFWMSSSRSSLVRRLINTPSLRASMNRISSVRLRSPFFDLSRERNHREAGICVFKKSFAGKFTMQSTNRASIRAFRMSP